MGDTTVGFGWASFPEAVAAAGAGSTVAGVGAAMLGMAATTAVDGEGRVALGLGSPAAGAVCGPAVGCSEATCAGDCAGE
jgi:hypothetical protein